MNAARSSTTFGCANCRSCRASLRNARLPCSPSANSFSAHDTPPIDARSTTLRADANSTRWSYASSVRSVPFVVASPPTTLIDNTSSRALGKRSTSSGKSFIAAPSANTAALSSSTAAARAALHFANDAAKSSWSSSSSACANSASAKATCLRACLRLRCAANSRPPSGASHMRAPRARSTSATMSSSCASCDLIRLCSADDTSCGTRSCLITEHSHSAATAHARTVAVAWRAAPESYHSLSAEKALANAASALINSPTRLSVSSLTCRTRDSASSIQADPSPPASLEHGHAPTALAHRCRLPRASAIASAPTASNAATNALAACTSDARASSRCFTSSSSISMASRKRCCKPSNTSIVSRAGSLTARSERRNSNEPLDVSTSLAMRRAANKSTSCARALRASATEACVRTNDSWCSSTTGGGVSFAALSTAAVATAASGGVGATATSIVGAAAANVFCFGSRKANAAGSISLVGAAAATSRRAAATVFCFGGRTANAAGSITLVGAAAATSRGATATLIVGAAAATVFCFGGRTANAAGSITLVGAAAATSRRLVGAAVTFFPVTGSGRRSFSAFIAHVRQTS
jgi:hypothetical protein